MRRLLFFSMITISTARSVHGQPVEWLTDVPAAQAKAKAEDKLVLLDFTGSDWCSWCMKLKREVFDQPEFTRFAASSLVMVEVDFPRRQTLPEPQQQANARLRHRYGVNAFPTIILLNGDGKQVGKMGYVAGGPAAFMAHLEKVIEPRRKAMPPSRAPAARQPSKPAKEIEWNPPPTPVAIHYGPLTLKSISGTKDHRIVLINNATMMTGESAKVRAEDREVAVVCKEIRDDSVLITCDGKEMELRLREIK